MHELLATAKKLDELARQQMKSMEGLTLQSDNSQTWDALEALTYTLARLLNRKDTK